MYIFDYMYVITNYYMFLEIKFTKWLCNTAGKIWKHKKMFLLHFYSDTVLITAQHTMKEKVALSL